MLSETAEVILAPNPDRLIMVVKDLDAGRARRIAMNAVTHARAVAPKLSGASAKRLEPIWGEGWFGIYFPDPYVWFQEQGIRPFTMRSLAGKTIPMWVDDIGGVQSAKNPKAKTRTTASGKQQILIFRKAALPGQRVTKTKMVRGQRVSYDAPASYPGAPGRIGVRQAGKPYTTPGKVAGAIAPGNSGVRWRHPGLAPRLFLNHALTLASQRAGILPVRVYVADGSFRPDTR